MKSVLTNRQAGRKERWQLENKDGQQLLRIAAAECQVRDYNFASISQKKKGYIITPEKQQEALEILKRYGTRIWECFVAFGQLDGVWKEYSPQGKVCKELHYCNGQLDEVVSYSDDGIQSRLCYLDGNRTLSYLYLNNRVISKMPYKNSKRNGEAEEYQYVGECNEPVLFRRYFWFDDQYDREYEEWDPLSGIRTLLAHRKNCKSEGTSEEWCSPSGIQTILRHFQDDKEEGTYERWHPVSGVRTALYDYKDGRRDGVGEEWDSSGPVYYTHPS